MALVRWCGGSPRSCYWTIDLYVRVSPKAEIAIGRFMMGWTGIDVPKWRWAAGAANPAGSQGVGIRPRAGPAHAPNQAAGPEVPPDQWPPNGAFGNSVPLGMGCGRSSEGNLGRPASVFPVPVAVPSWSGYGATASQTGMARWASSSACHLPGEGISAARFVPLHLLHRPTRKPEISADQAMRKLVARRTNSLRKFAQHPTLAGQNSR
jgi:hypothetical protein